MATDITASLVVSFDKSAGNDTSTMFAEVDNREDGLNAGKTDFVAGDSVYCLLYRTEDVTMTAVIPSAGSIVYKGYELIDVEEFVTFPQTNESTLRYPVDSGWTTPVWYGNNLGNITVDNQTRIVSATEGVGVAKVKYKTRAYKYLYQSPAQLNGTDVFDVLIFFAGVAP